MDPSPLPKAISLHCVLARIGLGYVETAHIFSTFRHPDPVEVLPGAKFLVPL